MKTQKLLVASLAIAIGAAVAGMMVAHRKTERAVEPVRVSQSPTSPAPAVSKSTTPAEMPTVETMPEAPPPPAVILAKPSPTRLPTRTAPPAQAGQQNQSIQDPDARVALSYVGADPDAEAYWVGAINDPNLSADERQNLIEDLNEDGLSDPQNPGPGDLPLIVNRLQLIEELAPGAMDRVNADAFAEAYKDLVNMYDSLTQN
jgi:hypothetical protein